MDLVEIYTEESLHEHDDHDHDDHGHGTEDEHIWTSIPNAITIMEKIADEVVSLDETLADTVYRNLEAYTAELTAVDTELREVINTAERKSIVVCDRFPFRYMTEEYGLDYCAAFSGCSSDTEPTLAMINSLVGKVDTDSIPAVFIIEFSDGATARAVSAETGAEILTLHSAHNVTREDFDSGITYADIMRRNIKALTDALN
jgi:zinc transport system substrate-binding protein